MIDRLLSALLVPVVVLIVTAAIIIGVGELLLALAHVQPELGEIKEPISIIAALALSVVILLGATWLNKANNGPEL
ncbi:hypothetical protein M1N24_03245 [Dehalococcoidia bacterium]|nr:hypothetical protein [Dehalococcoidia bacterium]